MLLSEVINPVMFVAGDERSHMWSFTVQWRDFGVQIYESLPTTTIVLGSGSIFNCNDLQEIMNHIGWKICHIIDDKQWWNCNLLTF